MTPSKRNQQLKAARATLSTLRKHSKCVENIEDEEWTELDDDDDDCDDIEVTFFDLLMDNQRAATYIDNQMSSNGNIWRQPFCNSNVRGYGTSRISAYRRAIKKQDLALSAKGSRDITSFFPIISNDVTVDNSDDDDDSIDDEYGREVKIQG